VNKLVSVEFDFENVIDVYDIEEANFNWPAYLLGEEYYHPIVSIDTHDDSINDDDQMDSTVILNETNEEIEIELKSIDDIEQQN
jgi:hypothetical protein